MFTVLVEGPSMTPTLRDGDRLIARRGGRAIRPGDLVVARFRARPDTIVVRRVARQVPDGWWLTSDNPFGGDDSHTLGAAEILGRILFRASPRPGPLHGPPAILS
ncbi:S24/S26 family peptidase [Longispora sp. NPDC051575]|uniref:S24 family peptidase n=1 Tax=Longispora sp. NPDC051575 TaxID=3154943 RepID=UPI00342D8C3A